MTIEYCHIEKAVDKYIIFSLVRRRAKLSLVVFVFITGEGILAFGVERVTLSGRVLFANLF